jgi:hypothetical protein
MWHARRYDSAMDSLPQPWTPPELEADSSPRSDYFSDPFRPHISYSEHIDSDNPWAPSPSRPDTPARMHRRCDTPADVYDPSRPKPVERLTDPAPYTPKRSLTYGAANDNGALRYPYTPDSSRILPRRCTELPSSPTPWDDYSEHSSSPVQNALSSCLAHFENLIHSQQPDEDQMEYIVGQFEAMTSFLSAPDSQTRRTDEHLFSEADGAGLGITDEDDGRMAKTDYVPKESHDAYVAEVGKYIQGIKKHVEDLKMRFDEVKTLNSIQLEVIEDLQRELHHGTSSSPDTGGDVKLVKDELEKLAHPRTPPRTRAVRRDSYSPEQEFGFDSWATLVDEGRAIERSETDLKMSASVAQICEDKSRYRKITIVRRPERRTIWSSIGQALDSFGSALREE